MNRMLNGTLAALLLMLLTTSLSAAERPPNVIFFLIDDKYDDAMQTVEFHQEYGHLCDKG